MQCDERSAQSAGEECGVGVVCEKRLGFVGAAGSLEELEGQELADEWVFLVAVVDVVGRPLLPGAAPAFLEEPLEVPGETAAALELASLRRDHGQRFVGARLGVEVVRLHAGIAPLPVLGVAGVERIVGATGVVHCPSADPGLLVTRIGVGAPGFPSVEVLDGVAEGQPEETSVGARGSVGLAVLGSFVPGSLRGNVDDAGTARKLEAEVAAVLEEEAVVLELALGLGHSVGWVFGRRWLDESAVEYMRRTLGSAVVIVGQEVIVLIRRGAVVCLALFVAVLPAVGSVNVTPMVDSSFSFYRSRSDRRGFPSARSGGGKRVLGVLARFEDKRWVGWVGEGEVCVGRHQGP